MRYETSMFHMKGSFALADCPVHSRLSVRPLGICGVVEGVKNLSGGQAGLRYELGTAKDIQLARTAVKHCVPSSKRLPLSPPCSTVS